MLWLYCNEITLDIIHKQTETEQCSSFLWICENEIIVNFTRKIHIVQLLQLLL